MECIGRSGDREEAEDLELERGERRFKALDETIVLELLPATWTCRKPVLSPKRELVGPSGSVALG